mmetsp:Transcript_20333/g.49437  ORF Transcript_20333/g.49437 Transcript_20333/m.49437 type:complete len:285 (-) Transcript_20333:431-1285(-)
MHHTIASTTAATRWSHPSRHPRPTRSTEDRTTPKHTRPQAARRRPLLLLLLLLHLDRLTQRGRMRHRVCGTRSCVRYRLGVLRRWATPRRSSTSSSTPRSNTKSTRPRSGLRPTSPCAWAPSPPISPKCSTSSCRTSATPQPTPSPSTPSSSKSQHASTHSSRPTSTSSAHTPTSRHLVEMQWTTRCTCPSTLPPMPFSCTALTAGKEGTARAASPRATRRHCRRPSHRAAARPRRRSWPSNSSSKQSLQQQQLQRLLWLAPANMRTGWAILWWTVMRARMVVR